MICSLEGKTCGACCWSPRLSRAELRRKLRRHRRQFRATKPRSSLGLLRHELLVRRGLDLIVAPLLIVPVVRGLVSTLLRRRLVCAFAAFLDDARAGSAACCIPMVRKVPTFGSARRFGSCGASDAGLRIISAPEPALSRRPLPAPNGTSGPRPRGWTGMPMVSPLPLSPSTRIETRIERSSTCP